VPDDKGWREFDAGGVTVGLHSGPPSPGRKGPKMAFLWPKDVAAMRQTLVKRGREIRQGVDGRISPVATATIGMAIRFSCRNR